MKFNPYIAGNPIRGYIGFYGRKDVLHEVMRVINNPNENAIVLFGQRRIGKTSILLQLKESLTETGEFVAVYFDLMDKASKDLSDVLHELAQQIAAATITTPISKNDFDEDGVYFRETFLPQISEALGNKKLVLLFDEFDVLDTRQQDQAGQRFFPYLRSWMIDIESVQFVFVIGRRPEELSIDTLATFKNIKSAAVALLDMNSTEEIIRQSEKNESLNWQEDSVKRVWYWTNGHPYLTQLLCSVVWESLYEAEPDEVPTVSKENVDAMIDATMQQGRNAFQWIWDGLPPAERVVMAAMAEAGDVNISHDELIRILRKSGVRLIVRELELAPETLVNWGWLKETKKGYRFIVQLLRAWVANNRPLRRVKEELDRLEPLAEGLYQTGQRFYSLNQVDDAESQLRQALVINPNHLKSRLLLGRILIEKNNIDDALVVLEEAFQYDPDASRAIYTQALLIHTENQDEEEQLAAYEKILEIDHDQPVAKERRAQILKKIGLEKGKEYEQAERWDDAVLNYETTLKEFPGNKEIEDALFNAKVQAKLAKNYALGIVAVEEGRLDEAQHFFAQTIAVQPDYKEASRYLYEIHQGNFIVVKKDKPAGKSATRSFAQSLEEKGTKIGIIGIFYLILIPSTYVTYLIDDASSANFTLLIGFSPLLILLSVASTLLLTSKRFINESASKRVIDLLKISGTVIALGEGVSLLIATMLYISGIGVYIGYLVLSVVIVGVSLYFSLGLFRDVWDKSYIENYQEEQFEITFSEYFKFGGIFNLLSYLFEFLFIIGGWFLAFFLTMKLRTGLLHKRLSPDERKRHWIEFFKAFGILIGIGLPLQFLLISMVLFASNNGYLNLLIINSFFAIVAPFWAAITTIELRKKFFLEIFELRHHLRLQIAAEKEKEKEIEYE